MIHQSLIYQDKFGTPAMRELWTEEAMLQGWLDLEAAVTAAQGDMGVVPKSVADKIVRNCNTKKITPKAVAAWHKKTGHVIVSLVKSFRDAVPDAGERFSSRPHDARCFGYRAHVANSKGPSASRAGLVLT